MNNLFRNKLILSFALLLVFQFARSQSVAVMTYNLRFDNPKDGINQWGNRKQKVFDLIKKYNPDLLGVQEALHHQITGITGSLPEYAFVGVGRDDGKEKGEYSALLYKKDRFDVLESNTFWLSETPQVPGSKSWDAAITRVATWARLRDRKTNTELFVINTHFDHIGKEARAKSAALLKVKASELAGNLPIIITGDFNATRDEAPYQEMMNTSRLALADPAPANPPGTFCTFGVNTRPCSPIDYIFHSLQLSSGDYTVITDNDGANYPSDHLPVMVRLSLKK
jgi:endonuclease/exonuclease/phosphatase family metal-dependent hydrolase